MNIRSDDKPPMEVLVVSGFLGAGKTTFIKHLLTTKIERLGRVALIVNEFGKIGIDGTVLSGRNVDMIELTSGCICCTMRSDFARALREIYDRIKPNFLVVEATGVAQPGEILDTLFSSPADGMGRLKCLVTVVDVEMFMAREVFGPFYENQIRLADILILNKVDLVEASILKEIQNTIRDMNREAEILTAEYCVVDPDFLFSRSPSGDMAYLSGIQDHDFHDGWGFQTFSFEDDRAIDRERLEAFLQSLSPDVFRVKGWLRFPESSALLDFTGGRYRIEPTDNHRTTALDFVGRHCDEKEILKAINECLANDADRE